MLRMPFFSFPVFAGCHQLLQNSNQNGGLASFEIRSTFWSNSKLYKARRSCNSVAAAVGSWCAQLNWHELSDRFQSLEVGISFLVCRGCRDLETSSVRILLIGLIRVRESSLKELINRNTVLHCHLFYFPRILSRHFRKQTSWCAQIYSTEAFYRRLGGPLAREGCWCSL